MSEVQKSDRSKRRGRGKAARAKDIGPTTHRNSVTENRSVIRSEELQGRVLRSIPVNGKLEPFGENITDEPLDRERIRFVETDGKLVITEVAPGRCWYVVEVDEAEILHIAEHDPAKHAPWWMRPNPDTGAVEIGRRTTPGQWTN
ncbi:hypothetical protein [Hydrocarboniphaga sp.]|uniref:hypothetical protein n=1 Tax=Hydrocarboniphaga sp. TaxID=2033016 RepID=UPI00262E99D7|nr:hypothetical protein [Hydrocarboniphaga sp.]